jgi:hypothetical protein
LKQSKEQLSTASITFSAKADRCHAFVKNTPQIGVEQQARKLRIIGHRGAAGLAPENTFRPLPGHVRSGLMLSSSTFS